MNRFVFGNRAPIEHVSFESKTRLPAIHDLSECRESFLPGMVNVWYEYLPACYDGKTPLPLIVQVHGGGNDGRRWADFTLWHILAERLGRELHRSGGLVRHNDMIAESLFFQICSGSLK